MHDANTTFPATPAAMSVDEFCAAHGGISRGLFYKSIKAGTGPRLMKVGTRTLITHESAADWRRDREAQVGPKSKPAATEPVPQ
jgi:hypothetical protein